MPGTTRYSATFDRTYEEEDRVNQALPPGITRRSRSHSLQAISGLDGRPYTPLGGRPPNQRSSSTDNGSAKGPEHIPTRTAKTTVKAHNNPFQFVKVGTCPLYKKAEEQLKKAKEVKKPDVLKEEEEEWQSNLDSWKSRRRKMSEDVFRRQEEIKQLEQEEQSAQVAQKKTKTFSEMVESRATRGRALSLCLISSPLEFKDWEFENKTHKNGSCSYTDESGENSTVNSDDEGVSFRGRLLKDSQSDSENNHRTNGDAHIEQNGSKLQTQNGDLKKLSELSSNTVQMKPKENSYIDSGLESISSSHRAGDTPDSGSDFSPDSNSSIDCDSPRTGVNVLEDFTSKTPQVSQDHEIRLKLSLNEKGHDFGFTFLGGKDEGQVLIASILEGSKAELSDIHLGDRIISIDGNDVSSKKHIEIVGMVQKGREKGQISLLLWRHAKPTESTNGFKADEKQPVKPNKSETQTAKAYEKSVESENEMYVDDYEELQRQSELLASSKKLEKTCANNTQEQTNGNKSPISNKDVISLKTSRENSSAPKLKESIANGAVEESNKIEQKTNSELNNENQRKNVIKVKRVRRKGVYALNVASDPNQIPQEGISTNSLFPLSPVTELPSPAEEAKTMVSTLSSNNAASVINSQDEVLPKEKSKETEVKLSSPNVKENAKSVTSASKTVKSVPSNELKNSSLENKTESVNVPSSTTKTNKDKCISLESSQNEKPKSVSSPKKVKVKVKKATASESVSATSPNIKEGATNSLNDVTTKAVTKETAKETNNLQIDDEKIGNGVQNIASSKIKENGVASTGTTIITSTTEAVTSKCEVPAIVSNNIGNLSPKVITKDGSTDNVTVSEKQSAITMTASEDKSKPHAAVSKKTKVKSKGNVTEQVASESTQVAKEASTSNTNNQDLLPKSLAKEGLPKKEQKPTPNNTEKPAKIVVNNENAVPSQTRENGDLLTGNSTVLPDSKPSSTKDKNLNVSAVPNKARNLSLKIDVKNESTNVSSTSPVSNKPPKSSPKTSPKTPQGEKSKPVFAQKKDISKPKVNNASYKHGCGLM